MEGREAKYIVYKFRTGPDGTWENHILLFGTGLVHKVFADNLIGSRSKVVSAGFVRFGAGGPVCYGRSDSLNLNSRPDEDTFLARLSFGDKYFE